MMQGARSIVVVMTLSVVAAFPVVAQSVDAMRRADSLTREWEVMWRRSDSLRVEAMFLRMRADSIRKAEAARKDDTTSTDIDSLILRRVREGTTPRGATLSDTLTALRLTDEGETGVASYYAEQFHGRRTSSGERYNMNDMTCAHRWLPFGTRLRVTNIRNEKSVVVRVNDRGPWKHSRMIDLSKAAAIELDMIRAGTATVRIEVVRD